MAAIAELIELIIRNFLQPDAVRTRDDLVAESRRKIAKRLKEKGAKKAKVDIYLDGICVTTDLVDAEEVLRDLFKNAHGVLVEPADEMEIIRLKAAMEKKGKKGGKEEA